MQNENKFAERSSEGKKRNNGIENRIVVKVFHDLYASIIALIYTEKREKFEFLFLPKKFFFFFFGSCKKQVLRK